MHRAFSQAHERSVGAGFREHDRRIQYSVKYASRQNFGDYLPELICKELLLYPKIDADAYRLIGSCIDANWVSRDLGQITGVGNGRVAYWCCGMRTDEALAPAIMERCLFFGARGPRTVERLGLPPETPIGDPGLLAPLFHTAKRSTRTSGLTICMPHMEDPKPDDELLRLSGADVVIRPVVEASETALRDILDQIASARFVLTGSLHGAIVAAAYGRPFAFWDNAHVDIPFKWEDFASSANFPAVFARDVAEGGTIYEDSIAAALSLPPWSPVLDVCPFQVRPSALIAALAHDHRIDDAVASTASAALESLPSFRPERVAQLQALSDASREARGTVRRVVGGRVGKAARRVKAAIWSNAELGRVP